MAVFVPRFVRQLRDVLLTSPADGEVLTYDSADEKWKNEAGGGGGGDLTDAVILAPASSARNVIQPIAGAVIAAIVKAHAAQSVDLKQWQDSTGAVLAAVGAKGVVTLSPSEGTVVPGLVPAFDDTTLFDIVAPADYSSAGGNFSWLWRVMAEEGLMAFGLDAYGDLSMLGTTGHGPSGLFMSAIDYPDLMLEIYSAHDVSPAQAPNVFLRGRRLSVASMFDPATWLFGIQATGAFWTNGAMMWASSGSPEGAVTAPVGSIFLRTDGGSGTTFYVKESGAGDTGWTAISVSGGAPTGATYITQTPDAGLSAEQALSALATGLVKNTTGTGVLSIAAAGTDYASQASVDEKVAKSLYDANTVLAADVDDTPAALTMGASTILARLAAGNIKAASVAEVMALLGVPNIGYLSGLYYINDTNAPAGSGIIQAEGLLTAVPFLCRKTTTFSTVATQQTVNGTAGALHRLGVYADNGSGYPGALLIDGGTAAADAGGNSFKEATINQQLVGGSLYWLVRVTQGGAGTRPTCWVAPAAGVTAPSYFASSPAAYNNSAWSRTGIAGALPDPFGGTPTAVAIGPFMYLKAA